MADKTPIEWTDATWNPITGCSVVSPGCTNCYAMKLAGTRLRNIPSRKGLTNQTKAGPVWSGQVRFNKEALLQPLQWKRPRMIFVCAHGDLFAEGVSDEWIDQVFGVMALAPHHTFQVLTKRPDRMLAYLTKPRWRPVLDFGQDEQPSYWVSQAAGKIWCRLPSKKIRLPDHLRTFGQMAEFERDLRIAAQSIWPLPNVWLGVSAEDQTRANERIPLLLKAPAAVRWLSAEPLLGPLCLDLIDDGNVRKLNVLDWISCGGEPYHTKTLDWVVAGGESGPGARPMHPEWVRSLRDQCAAAGVPFFFKQWGNWSSIMDRDKADPDWRADYSNRLNQRHPDIRWLNLEGGSGFHGARFHVMQRIGKAKAGRVLDGVTHDAFPNIERTA